MLDPKRLPFWQASTAILGISLALGLLWMRNEQQATREQVSKLAPAPNPSPIVEDPCQHISDQARFNQFARKTKETIQRRAVRLSAAHAALDDALIRNHGVTVLALVEDKVMLPTDLWTEMLTMKHTMQAALAIADRMDPMALHLEPPDPYTDYVEYWRTACRLVAWQAYSLASIGHSATVRAKHLQTSARFMEDAYTQQHNK